MPDKEKGVYRKFEVTRTDGSSQPGGKHEDCQYFVLDLSHDKYSRVALRAYATACREEFPLLSADIIESLEWDPSYLVPPIPPLNILRVPEFIDDPHVDFLKRLRDFCVEHEAKHRQEAERKPRHWWMHRDPMDVREDRIMAAMYGMVAKCIKERLERFGL